MRNNRLLAMAMFFLALSMLCFFQIVECQELHIIATNKTDDLPIRWEHDGLDIHGNPDKLKQYDIYLSTDDGPFNYIGSTPKDTVNWNPPKEYVLNGLVANAKHVPGVKAVDWVGNESGMHKSVDATAAMGGWFLVIDIGAPRDCFRLGP